MVINLVGFYWYWLGEYVDKVELQALRFL